MKRTLASAFACVCALAGTSAWGQPPSDCRPSALNIPGAPYPCVYPDNRVMFRVVAPEAHKVRVRLGPGFDMAKEPDGLWYVTTTPQVVGFHYYTTLVANWRGKARPPYVKAARREGRTCASPPG